VHRFLPDHHGAGGEAAGYELPQLGVARRVGVDHGLASFDLVLVQIF
jgi:hypothetical protein